MTRISRFLLVAIAAGLASPALAHAEERTLTFTTPAISVEGYGVAQQPMPAESPKVDGYVVGMEAEVVDAQGRVQGRDKVMLHHIVFAKVGVPDYTCGGAAERFFAEGEERLALSLPRGYGYANKATDRWGLLYMLMNHKPQRLNGFIRYTVRYVTGERLTPVKPIWLDVRNCSGPDPVFDVPGRRADVLDLHEVGGLHDAAERPDRLWRWSSPRRRHPGRAARTRPAARSSSRHARPGAARSRSRFCTSPARRRCPRSARSTGIPVAKGDRLRINAVYDNSAPHTRAMGIMLLFLAPGAVEGCGATPALDVDLGRPAAPPAFSMPLPRAPKGKVSRATSTVVGEFQYGAERVVLKRGTTFTWRFMGSLQHDVTVVGGPVGFSAPWTQSGIFTHRFTKAGTYRLFCSLHPSKMVQQITVR